MPSPFDEAAAGRDLIAILSDLIALRSDYPPGDTRAISDYAAARLRRAGYATDVVTAQAPAANVVARLGSGRPSVVFNAHADTVSPGILADWRTDPFAAHVTGGRVYGLGASNCKGSMAVHLWLAETIAKANGPARGEVVFTFVGDEEALGPDGMDHLRRAGLVRPDVLILGAPTENQPIIAERGVLWVRLTARGRAAHAGEPAAGDNAILRMMRLLAAIERGLAPQLARRTAGAMQSTVNVGLIRGGANTNVVPAECTVEIDRRLLPDERVEDAFAEIRDILAAAGEPADRYAVERLRGTNGFRGNAEGASVRAVANAIRARTGRPPVFGNAIGVSDGRYFADDGIEIVNIGPGGGTEGHSSNESVAIAELVDAAAIHLAIVRELVGLKRGDGAG